MNVDNEFFMIEGFLEGKFVKYSNNSHYMTEDLKTEIKHLTAFSHFVYENSKKQYMIHDFQGEELLLTDPVIHSHNGHFRQSGDLGEEGFVTFLRFHQCNTICTDLGLTPNINSVPKKEKWVEERGIEHNQDSIRSNVFEIFCTKKHSDQTSLYCINCKNNNLQKKPICPQCSKEYDFSPMQYYLNGFREPPKCGGYICKNATKKFGF